MQIAISAYLPVSVPSVPVQAKAPAHRLLVVERIASIGFLLTIVGMVFGAVLLIASNAGEMVRINAERAIQEHHLTCGGLSGHFRTSTFGLSTPYIVDLNSCGVATHEVRQGI